MTDSTPRHRRSLSRLFAGMGGVLILLSQTAGCSSQDSDRVQGYVEGEYVYVSSPLAGTVQTLSVRRGDQVSAGMPLFTLDDAPEKAARDEAERKLAMNRANWEDVKKGKRPTEIESMEAQLNQAKAALKLSEEIKDRQEALFRSNAASKEELDRARSAFNQDRQRATQLAADLATARLGSREDQIAAADANVRAAEAVLAKAEWDLAQKTLAAPKAGIVFDTLFWPGEFVSAGKPVVALLPPEYVKVRAFVPEVRIGSVKVGQSARVMVDGVAEPFVGKVIFISPQAEYTPPVIYSRESRAKLVFKIEIVFDPKDAANLHPGQPVDVQLTP